MKSQNRLAKDNCNKSKCKTCIFGENPLGLSNQRMSEIKSYLSKFESSHICHTTNKTCYGSLEYQSNILYNLGLIKENTVDSMLNAAKQILNL